MKSARSTMKSDRCLMCYNMNVGYRRWIASQVKRERDFWQYWFPYVGASGSMTAASLVKWIYVSGFNARYSDNNYNGLRRQYSRTPAKLAIVAFLVLAMVPGSNVGESNRGCDKGGIMQCVATKTILLIIKMTILY